MFFDTHTHLDDNRFDADREAVITACRESGVSLAVNVGADMPSSQNSVALAQSHDFIYAAVGVHPHEVEPLNDADMDTLKRLAKESKVVAIGEIGLDYYYDNSPRELQKKWFARQLELAKELGLPYIVHDRDAHGDTMDIIRESGYYNGVLHCFSGSAEMAKELVKWGMMISFAGPVTFKNATKVKEAAMAVPMERLLIETDSPYLTPEPHRGKRNDSSYVRYVAEEIARLRGLEISEAARITKENGMRFFGIEKQG